MRKISENKDFKDLTYSDNGVQVVERDQVGKIIDIIQRSVYENNKALNGNFPPGYYDYIEYKHRDEAYRLISTSDESISEADNLFRIGDCFFIIPPEYINITVESGHDSIQGLRQSNSIQTKHGYSKRNIHVSLVLNGMNQINGYEVPSPFSYNYYVDGLRALISQFKYTPFLPIENPLINLVHGIFAVALRGINISTMEGFPQTLRIDISMQEFNTKAYIHEDESVFDDVIDWDLYRYYTQQPLRANHKNYLAKITSPELTSRFSFKILKKDVLSGYKLNSDGSVSVDSNGNPIVATTDYENILENTIDINNNKYYEEMITDRDNLYLTNITIGLTNIMPVMQLSDHESPTHQYLGTTDSEFNFTFQTNDENMVARFNDMNTQNLDLIRENKEISGIGFMKIENELVKLAGVNLVLINNIDVSTIPGFPGMYVVNVNCVSYDANQKESEKLIALKPFPNGRDGTKSDFISQEVPGVTNKIRQDAEIEKQLMELELYPDLSLPTYEEVDSAITSIRKFRSNNNLISQMAISKLPRNTCEMPGYIKDVEYSKYVDPDFYVMYTSKLSDMTISSSATQGTKSAFASIPSSALSKLTNEGISTFSKSNITEILNQAGDNILDIFPFTKPKPDIAIEPGYTYGYEDEEIRYNTSTGGSSEDKPSFGGGTSSNDGSGRGSGDPSVDPVRVKKKYGNPFVDLCCNRADALCGYVWGAHGQIYSSDLRYGMGNQFGHENYIGTEKWYGVQVFDCSGLICWAMRKIGLKPEGFRVVSGQFGSYGTRVSPNDIQVGDVFYDGAHCGIVLDGGNTVEAMGTEYGVCYGKVNKSRYNFVRFSGLKEANATFLRNNRNFYISSNPIDDGGNTVRPYSITSDYDIDFKNSKGMQSKAPGGNGNTIVSDGGGKLKPTKLANFGNNDPCDKWNNQIIKVSTELGIDPNIIKCIIKIESSGDPKAISSYDYPNIVGLMQVYLKYHKDKFKGSNYTDPEDNIYAGTSILKSYASASWVNFDIERTIASYNYGPGNAYSVYVSKTKSLPDETKNYIEKFKMHYRLLRVNGAEPGTLRTFSGFNPGSVGTGSTGGNEYFPDMPDDSHNMNNDNGYFDDMPTNIAYPNPNSGKAHNSAVNPLNISLLGKSTIDFISKATAKDGKYFSFDGNDLGKKLKKRDTAKNIELMFHDMVQYSHKGRLSRAFPSFIFVVADEQSDWINGEKLWTNYYVYRSVLDISIHQAYDNPISTAKVTLSNFNNNLAKIISRPSTKDLLDEGFTKWVYGLTGAIINEYISDEMIKLKNQLRKELSIHEGARVHIRMGYGSNPAKYPTSFNGTITNIEHGELITLIAQSDGIELMNNPLTDKIGQTNKDIGLPVEVSNIAANLLCSRDSDFLYTLTGGNSSINSKHGIEHFGMYFDSINGLDLENTFNPSERDGVQIDLEFLMNEYQYDLVQNIYKGRYDAVPYSAVSFLGIDGEANYRFFASGRNPWDVVKMCEKALPDFVAYPRYFGFETRLFYGVPTWECGYKYEIDNANGDLYRRAKSFAQAHTVTSFDSIINNEISIDTRNLYTNFVGIYTLGGDLATTPAVMSDSKIDWSRQRTKTIDTTSVQDFAWVPGFIDKFVSLSGLYDNGKKMAIYICISELMNSWRETYTGSLLLLGQSEISAHDWVYLDDTNIRMSGMVTVREVVHSMSVSTGFTTSIIPGMITFNTIKQSGLSNCYRSVVFVGSATVRWLLSKQINLRAMALVSKVYSSSKTAIFLVNNFRKVANFTATKGNDIYTAVKTGKAVTKGIEFVRTTDKLCDVAKGVKKIYTIGKGVIKGLMATSIFTPHGLIAIAATLLIDFLIGWLITAFVDMFAYRNCVVINPLLISEKDGTVKAYAGNIKGGQKILPIANEVGTSDEA